MPDLTHLIRAACGPSPYVLATYEYMESVFQLYRNAPENYTELFQAKIKEDRTKEIQARQARIQIRRDGMLTESSNRDPLEDMQRDGILHISASGPIVQQSTSMAEWLGVEEISTNHLSRIMRMAENSKSVNAVALKLTTPGGIAIPCMNFAALHKTFKKPLYVLGDFYVTSGGIAITAYAKKIFSTPHTEWGSVGALVKIINTHEADKKMGIERIYITSAPQKIRGVPGPDGKVSKEDLKSLQDEANAMGATFTNLVKDGRNLTSAQLQELADGGIFPADHAKKLGLIDDIIVDPEQFHEMILKDMKKK